MHVARRGEQMVLDLVAETTADEVPEERATAEVGCGLDLKLRPVY